MCVAFTFAKTFCLLYEGGKACVNKKENEKYELMIAVYRNDLCHKFVVRHAPLNLSEVLSFKSYLIQYSLVK